MKKLKCYEKIPTLYQNQIKFRRVDVVHRWGSVFRIEQAFWADLSNSWRVNMPIRLLDPTYRGGIEMKRLIAILLLAATLCSCVPNDSTANYRKVDVVVLCIYDMQKRLLLVSIDGCNAVRRYDLNTFQVSWLTMFRIQYDRPHFTLIADDNNRLYHL